MDLCSIIFDIYIRFILNIYGYIDYFVGCHFLTYRHQKTLKLKKWNVMISCVCILCLNVFYA